MKALKVFAFCIIFFFVMYLFSLLLTLNSDVEVLAENPSAFNLADLVLNVGLSLILGTLSGILISYFVTIDIVKLYMYGLFVGIVGGTCTSTVSNIAVIAGNNTMAIGIFAIVKVLVWIIVMFAGFAILVGGDWDVN